MWRNPRRSRGKVEKKKKKEEEKVLIQSHSDTRPFNMSRRMLLVVLVFIVIIVSGVDVIDGRRQVVSFKKNLEQVMNKKMCKEPQQRLVYLGNT